MFNGRFRWSIVKFLSTIKTTNLLLGAIVSLELWDCCFVEVDRNAIRKFILPVVFVIVSLYGLLACVLHVLSFK